GLHVWSLSVLELPEKRGRSLTESEPLASPEMLPNGYAQSKWAADMMMMRARERGFEVAICRAPWLLDPLDAQVRADGFIRNFIAACVQMGRVPDSTMNLNLMPVDFVGKAIAAIASRSEAIEAVYHLGAGRMLAVWELASLISTSASEVALEPLEAWSERVGRKLLGDEDNFPLKRYSSLFRESDSSGSVVGRYLRGDMPTMNSRITHDKLRAMGLAEIPSLDTVSDLVRATAVTYEAW